ncbi:Pumilio 2 [Branchiostoma belcheri]|nr:Pumilio 2 [Branchiostoma belcheri]
MHEGAWESIHASKGQQGSGSMNPGGHGAGSGQGGGTGGPGGGGPTNLPSRSQDDAMVGYFFQRQPGELDGAGGGYRKPRWAIGDDGIGDQMRMAHMNSEFEALSLEGARDMSEIVPSAKKLWDVGGDGDTGGKAAGDEPKSIFLGDQWRESTWGSVQTSMSDHSVSQPIMVQQRRASLGGFHGNDVGSVLSPRSSEASGLGVSMVEYVLGSSPGSKEIDSRMNRLKESVEQAQGNPGTVNGAVKDDKGSGEGLLNRTPGSRQASPTSEENKVHISQAAEFIPRSMPTNIPNQHNQVMQTTRPMMDELNEQTGNLTLDPLEPVTVDPLQFDYSGQMGPNMESPGNFVAYDQQQQLFRQQPLTIQQLTAAQQQQYALAAAQQQQQLGLPTVFAPNPYIISAAPVQDPYAAGLAAATLAGAPAVVPPQYAAYNLHPWGVSACSGPSPVRSVQPAPVRGNQGRPMTPQQQGQEAMTPQQQQQALQQALPATHPGVSPGLLGAGYQVLAPAAYYDQSGQLVMGSARAVGAPVRLVPPGPLLLNTAQPGESE